MIDTEQLNELRDKLIDMRLVYNNTDFAQRIGKARSYVSEALNGRRAITEQFVLSIGDAFPEISKDWLLTGEGEMLIASEHNNSTVAPVFIDDKENYDLAVKSGMNIIPEFSDHFKGGNDGTALTIDKAVAFWGLPNIKANLITEIDGDSMAPRYPAGTKVAVREIFFDREYPTVGIPFGEVFAIVLDNGNGEYLNFIKYLRRHPDRQLVNKYWVAQSENSEKYDNFDIEVSKVKHLFVVVASLRLNRL